MNYKSNHSNMQDYLFNRSKDPNLFVLGKLCNNKHDDGDGSSIRYKSSNNCLRCQDKYYLDNYDKIQNRYQSKKKLNQI